MIMGSALLGGVSTPKVFRGLGQNMTITGANGIGYIAGANWSLTSRSRHYSKVAFQRFRIVLQTFDALGTNPITDTDFANSYTFQVGLEYPYTLANTGIAARIPVTFSGANTAAYVAGAGPFGYILSDIIDLGSPIPAGAFFGLWTTVENTLGAGSPTGTLPTQRLASNFLEKYIGSVQSQTSQIAAGTALSATSITHTSTARAGVGQIFTPCMMLVEVPASSKMVVLIGDSMAYGTGEGDTDNSSTSGDVMGSALANAGPITRGLYEVAGLNSINLGRGNDGNKFLITAANWTYRKQLMVLANPTHVINENGGNDAAASITVSGWAGSTAYAKYSVRNNGANQYLCIQAGTSGTPGGGPTGTAQSIVDGTCLWAYVQVKPAAANAQGSAQIYGWDVTVSDQIRTALPTVKILGGQIGPSASSTDSYTTTGNQTSTWGSPNPTRRTLTNSLRQTYQSGLLGWVGIVDFRPQLENDYTNAPGIWIANGVNANTQTKDGIHSNSSGALIGQACVSAGQFT